MRFFSMLPTAPTSALNFKAGSKALLTSALLPTLLFTSESIRSSPAFAGPVGAVDGRAVAGRAPVTAEDILNSESGAQTTVIDKAIKSAAAGFAVGDPREIVGGSRIGFSTPGIQSAVGILSSDGSICTGTLVASNIVVTAAHCLQGNSQRSIIFSETMSGPNVVSRQVTDGRVYAKAKQTVFPNYDIGWLRFSGSLPQGFAPAEILKHPAKIKPDTPVVLVGWGSSGDNMNDGGTRRAVETKVQRYVNNTTFKSLLVLGPLAGRGACHGDSGGPAYAQFNNTWFLVAETNGIDPRLTASMTCNSGHSIYTFIGDYMRWIEETANIEFPY